MRRAQRVRQADRVLGGWRQWAETEETERTEETEAGAGNTNGCGDPRDKFARTNGKPEPPDHTFAPPSPFCEAAVMRGAAQGKAARGSVHWYMTEQRRRVGQAAARRGKAKKQKSKKKWSGNLIPLRFFYP